MTNSDNNSKPRTVGLKNEATRLRWDLFHRAILHAKQTNESALQNSSNDVAPRPASLESLAS